MDLIKQRLSKMPKKSKRGGARPNSGPKLKYGEPTKVVQTRCPVSKVKALKELINKSLEEWKTDTQ
jgi:hypothetical protein